MSFNQQHIVITGASSGIGRALVMELANYHCHVLAIDKDAIGLRQLSLDMETSRIQLQMLELDLANLLQIQQLVHV